MAILSIQNVSKNYQNVPAVKNITLDIPPQTIFGLLGPNGAGKTSLIRMITQITGVDSGQIFFQGEALQPKHTSLIGYMPEERGLYKKMKVGEQLIYLARLKDLSKKEATQRIKEWLERFQISDWWTKKVEDLSKGMQQKVQFISTVMHQPKLLILDEPFSGLDPINATLIRDEIFRLVKEEHISILFSTHRMEQVEEICEQIVLINQGENILQGSVQELRQAFKKNCYQLQCNGQLPQELMQLYRIEQRSPKNYFIHLNDEQHPNAVLQQCIEQGIEIQSFQEVLPSMNEIFIERVQNQAE